MVLYLILFSFLIASVSASNKKTTEIPPTLVKYYQCKDTGSYLGYIRTKYYQSKHLRAWRFRCHQFDTNTTEEIESCIQIPASPDDTTQDIDVRCPQENGYIAGMGKWWSTETNYTTYRFKCCEHGNRTVFKPACYTTKLVDPLGASGADLSEVGPPVGFKGVYDSSSGDRTWFINVCTFRKNLQLTSTVYRRFPTDQKDYYGVKQRNYELRSQCIRGKVILRIDSAFGMRNTDRVLFAKCDRLYNPKYYWPERFNNGTFKNPQNWTLEGCSGQEVLIGIHSLIKGGTRRYGFRCCALRRFSVNESQCYEEQVSDEKLSDWTAVAPENHIMRGISMQYDQLLTDRYNVTVEYCPLDTGKRDQQTTTTSTTTTTVATTTEAETTTVTQEQTQAETTWTAATAAVSQSGCKYEYTDKIPQNVIRKTYQRIKTGSVDECAKKCIRLSFCFSFRYNSKNLCQLSYARARHCSTKTLTYFDQSTAYTDTVTDLWFPCSECE